MYEEIGFVPPVEISVFFHGEQVAGCVLIATSQTNGCVVAKIDPTVDREFVVISLREALAVFESGQFAENTADELANSILAHGGDVQTTEVDPNIPF